MLSISFGSVTDAVSRTLDRSIRRRRSSTVTRSTTSPDSGLAKGEFNPPQQSRILHYLNEVPSWYCDNPFILSGYRPVSNSGAKCLRSLLYIHNETANIYSHLFAAAAFILAQHALQKYLTTLHPAISAGDRLAIAFEGFTAALCFLSSVAYHSLICHSESVFRFSLKCDYIGIITLIVGNFLSGLHISFHCAPTIANFYSIMIVTLGSITGFIVLSPKFQGPNFFHIRLKAFIMTGLSGFLPIIHAFLLYGSSVFMRIGGQFYLLEGVFLLIGAYLFANRIPECWSPGSFDVWGQSHTLWHILVFLAMATHVYGLLDALDYHYNYGTCIRT